MMEFTNQFHVPLPLDKAWALLTDIPRVMPCMPGATLKGTRDDGQYLGSILVKLGPIRLSFDGQAEFVRKDEKQHIAWLKGSGLDPKGRGSAESEFSFALTPAPGGGTDVKVTTALQLSGAVAQYGRGSGMIAEVAGHILKQFEENLAASLQDEGSFGTPATATSTSQGIPISSYASMAEPTHRHSNIANSQTISGVDAQTNMPANTKLGTPELQALLLQSLAVLAQSQALLVATQQMLNDARRPPGQVKPKELNMLSIGLKAIWSQFKGLFKRH